MISYLEDWLLKRAGRAPVWVSLVGDKAGHRYTMLAVDNAGIVVASPSSNNEGVAYPWSVIYSVYPDRKDG